MIYEINVEILGYDDKSELVLIKRRLHLVSKADAIKFIENNW